MKGTGARRAIVNEWALSWRKQGLQLNACLAGEHMNQAALVCVCVCVYIRVGDSIVAGLLFATCSEKMQSLIRPLAIIM